TRSDRDWSSDVCSSDLHSTAAVIGQRYYDYSKTHPVGAGLAYSLLDAHDAEPRLVRPRDGFEASYVDALDARLRKLWLNFYAQRSEERRVGKGCRAR